MSLNKINYLICEDIMPISLESLYSNNTEALKLLDFNLEAIISTEAPITLNLLKERLREVFNVKKISGKALDIIFERLDILGFPVTDNLYDKVYWSLDGIYNPSYIRINYQRQIYDVPYQELSLVIKYYINNNLDKETIFRNTLAFFGYEVLTEKAYNYLSFVYEKCME